MPSHPSRRQVLTGGVAASATLLFAGCGAAAPSDTPASSPAGEATARTITDPTGREVTIPADPQAVLGFYTTDIDILVTLGFTALAPSQPVRIGYDTWPSYFPAEPLAGVEPFANYPEFNYEAVLAAGPDFILNGLAYDESTAERLPGIAPTLSYNGFDGQDWRVHFKANAELLGRTAQWQAWTDTYDAQVAETKEQLAASQAGDWTVVDVGYWSEAVQVGGSGVPLSALTDLELTLHPLMTNETTVLAAEKVGELADADVAFMAVGAGETGRANYEATMKALDASPIWRDLPFVRNNRIFTYELEMTFGSPNGQSAFVDAVTTTLLEAS